MADTIDTQRRSANMSRIRAKNTGPELRVRSLLHRMGYRFRLHRADLPGTPDIVLPKYRVAIFVNGCFWHRHPGCKYAYTPKSREGFWQAKFARTLERDQQALEGVSQAGWHPVVIWECDTKSSPELEKRLREELRESAPKERHRVTGDV